MIIDKIREQLEVQAAAEIEASEAVRRGERDVNHASEIGWLDDCVRRLVLLRVSPEAEVIEEESKMIFREGRIQEGIFRAEMIAAGFPLVRPLVGELSIDEHGLPLTGAGPLILATYQIKGVADDLLRGEVGANVPIDYKSCSRPMFGKIRNMTQAADFENAKQIWLRHYIPQMYAYMALYDSPIGILAFRNKENGKKHFIEIAWSSKGQDYLDRLAEVNAMVSTGAVPEAIEKEACRKCSFRAHCWGGDYVAPLTIEAGETSLDDEDLAADLDRRAELEPFAKEFGKLDDEIKDRFAGTAGVWSVAGRWLVENHPYAMKTAKVPDEIKKQYEATVMRNKYKIRPAAETK